MKFLALLALFTGLIVLQSSGHAAQPQVGAAKGKGQPQPQPSTKSQRTQYSVKHLDASALASVLNKHFKGEAEIVAVTAGTGNTLLVSGSSESISEVIKLLEQLDQKLKTIEIELVIAEIVSKKGTDGKEKEVDVSGLEPIAKLEALTKGGQIGTVQRIKLTAVEGQPISSTNMGNKPYVSSATVGGGFNAGGGFNPNDNPVPGGGKGGGPGGGGVMRRSISYHESGTTVKLTARIGAEDVIALDLSVQDSKIRSAEAGDEVGAAAFDSNTLNTKLNVLSGKAVAAQTVRTEGKTSGTLSLVIVTARVVEPGTTKSK